MKPSNTEPDFGAHGEVLMRETPLTPAEITAEFEALKRDERGTVIKAVLVYQAGIANVFSVSSFNLSDYGRDAIRLLQADFRTCESFARGLAAAGVVVRSAACNQAGDIIRSTWSEDFDAQPFSEKFRPVAANTRGPIVSEIDALRAERDEAVSELAALKHDWRTVRFGQLQEITAQVARLTEALKVAYMLAMAGDHPNDHAPVYRDHLSRIVTHIRASLAETE